VKYSIYSKLFCDYFFGHHGLKFSGKQGVALILNLAGLIFFYL